jgi:hypothetical protein
MARTPIPVKREQTGIRDEALNLLSLVEGLSRSKRLAGDTARAATPDEERDGGWEDAEQPADTKSAGVLHFASELS